MPEPSLAEFDRNAAESVELFIDQSGRRIPFQFPPRVTSDTKVSKWFSTDLKAYEPLKIFDGSEARKFTLEFEYIATGEGEFSPSGIANILRSIKSYGYITVSEAIGNYPTVSPVIYDILPTGGGRRANCRLMNISITHGPEVVKEGNVFFHLYTKVNLELELVTKIGGIQQGGGGSDGDGGASGGGDPSAGETPKVKAPQLAVGPAFEWF